MIGNLEPEENVMRSADWVEHLNSALQKLKWTADDDIAVEIGGVAFSGIKQTESANPKWSKPYGTISYQNDAFIVIKNKSRSPVVPSQPNNEKV
jgi:hypothetical protein